MNRHAKPYSRCSSSKRSSTRAWTETSRADVGSSAINSSGPRASARARLARWRCPPDSSCGNRSPYTDGSWTASSSSSTRGRASLGSAARPRVDELLEAVQLPSVYGDRFPHELSGGQRQRASLARALPSGPELLIADEPTSALDVSVQARVLDLFDELQREYGFACLFISHDLAVVDLLADRIAVLYRGRLVEEGTGAEVLGAPKDPYTQRLLASLPVPDPDEQATRRAEWNRLRAQG